MLSVVDRMDPIETDFEDDSEVEDLSPRISLGSVSIFLWSISNAESFLDQKKK